jgi:hypothetical protein
MKAPWWAAFPPVTARVSCGSARHRLRWENGQLTAADHPEGESELVLAALGGEAPGCITMIQAWNSQADNLDVLATGPRTARDKIAVPEASGLLPLGRGGATFSRPMVAASSSTLTMTVRTGAGRAAARTAVRRKRQDPAADRLLGLFELFKLGVGFQFRLMATVAANLAGRPDAYRPALAAALTGRFAPAAASWLGLDPAKVEVTGHEGDGWGELALSNGRLRASLPVGWLASVWAPGLAVTGGRLVTEVVSGTWPVLEVRAIVHPGTEPVPARVTRRAGRWVIRARPAGGSP